MSRLLMSWIRDNVFFASVSSSFVVIFEFPCSLFFCFSKFYLVFILPPTQ